MTILPSLKMIVLPSIMWKACHSVKKCNIMTQKMHITCNYKAWRVYYSILNSIGQCAKCNICWGKGG